MALWPCFFGRCAMGHWIFGFVRLSHWPPGHRTRSIGRRVPDTWATVLPDPPNGPCLWPHVPSGSPTFRTLNNYWWKDYCRPWNDSWWTFSGRLSIVERQWSTISGRPSKATIDGRPRSVTIDRQPWIVNHCRSIIGSRLLMCEY